MTSQRRDRRWVARFIVPRHLTEPDLELRRVRLLDLSAKGARIEHLEHLHEGLVRTVDLPSILGGLRLTGQVVWTKLPQRVQTFERDTRIFYQTGLAFVDITPEQREALAGALRILETGELPDDT
jgi:PilZ domain-containing protein